MRFTKLHGLGNDYVYVNGYEEDVEDPAALARQIAHRHFGVGGDGLIMVVPPDPGVDADVRMRMFNADGSEAEMCGNGVRCVCKLAHDHGLSHSNPMRIQTGNGVLTLEYTLDEADCVDTVTVDMGPPVLESALVPVRIDAVDPGEAVVGMTLGRLVQWPPDLAADWIDHCGFDSKMTCVSMGNPHAVLCCECVENVELQHVGPTLELHPMFPNRVNVHVFRADGEGELTMRTWERGSGLTMACGTGACAVAVAAHLTGKAGREVLVHLPGGDLTIDWREADDHVYMTGPAVEVFRGEWQTQPRLAAGA